MVAVLRDLLLALGADIPSAFAEPDSTTDASSAWDLQIISQEWAHQALRDLDIRQLFVQCVYHNARLKNIADPTTLQLFP